MGDLLDFPVEQTAEKIEKRTLQFIEEEKKAGRCILCGKQIHSNDGLCQSCIDQRNRVRCINPSHGIGPGSGFVHILSNKRNLSEVHKNIPAGIKIDGSYSGAFVGACYKCDSAKRKKRIYFRLI